ncbi:MAG: Zinc finger, C2H2 [archaeon GW2011_AR5]|nr:MAG: Zinc finger, C2H2 [archaeon GW2011_AR5]
MMGGDNMHEAYICYRCGASFWTTEAIDKHMHEAHVIEMEV